MPDTADPQEPRQPVGAGETHAGHNGHRHAC
jgi:hypothetical protein